jgi:hypothetical protein
MQYKEVGDFCLDLVGSQILLFQKTMWKEMSFKVKHMEGLPNDKC